MFPFSSTPYPVEERASKGRLSNTMPRNRQSYANPFQQTFDQTRSALITGDQRSMLGETFRRQSFGITLNEETDFVTVMEELHAKFSLAISSLQSITDIFLKINEWKNDILFALDQHKTIETDISDADYDKLRTFLRKEYETWDLIENIYFRRLDASETIDDNANAVPAIDQIYDKFCINETQYVKKIESAGNLQEMRLVIEWLQRNFQKNRLPDLNEKYFIWEHTRDALRLDKLLPNPSSRSMVSYIDPDAPLREGKQLHPLDAEETIKVLRGAYYYIRTGDIEQAVVYLAKSGDKVRSANLTGFQYTAKVHPETGNEDKTADHVQLPSMEYSPASNRQPKPQIDFKIIGNPRRDLWKQISWKFCSKDGLSKYDKALLGAVCGHRESLLGVSQNWEDRLWAFLKVSYDVTVEEALRKASSSKTRKELPANYWAQRLTTEESITKADALSNIKSDDSPLYALHLLQKCVILDKIEDFLSHLEEFVQQLLQSYNHPLLDGHVVRFVTHLQLVFAYLSLPYSQDLLNICLDGYISELVRTYGLTFIPYYVQKLSEEMQIPVAIRHIHPDVTRCKSEVQNFLLRCKENELNVLSIGVAVVEKLRSDEDDFSVQNLEWISCCYDMVEDPVDVIYEWLKYTIWITRKYLTLGDIRKVEKLINQLGSDIVSQASEHSEILKATLIREFICYNEYLAAEGALSTWQKVLSQKPRTDDIELPVSSSMADHTVFEKRKREREVIERKWRRAVEFHLNNAIEKFFAILEFPGGWLRDCYDETDEDETFHIGAVRRIILNKVALVLLKLVQNKNDSRTIRHYVDVLSDDRRNLLCELADKEVGNILTVIEQLTRENAKNVMYLPK